jgi:hypothetical protein
MQQMIDDQTGVDEQSSMIAIFSNSNFSFSPPFQGLQKHRRTFLSIPDEWTVRGIRGLSCDSHYSGLLSLFSDAAIVSAFMQPLAIGEEMDDPRSPP